MKAVRHILEFAVIVLGTVLLTRALYTTGIGGQVLRVIPDEAWNRVYAVFGLEGAETTANAEFAFWLSICFALSAAVVLGGGRVCRYWLRPPR